MVVALRNVARPEELFRGMSMKVVTKSRYLGEFIGDQEAENTLLDEKVQGWIELARMLSVLDLKHPQSSYPGMQKLLQKEWEFVQRVTPNIGDAFGPVETALWDAFMPALFQGVGEGTWNGRSPALQLNRPFLPSHTQKRYPPRNGRRTVL